MGLLSVDPCSLLCPQGLLELHKTNIYSWLALQPVQPDDCPSKLHSQPQLMVYACGDSQICYLNLGRNVRAPTQLDKHRGVTLFQKRISALTRVNHLDKGIKRCSAHSDKHLTCHSSGQSHLLHQPGTYLILHNS
eukprot:c27595_g2_i2 orf=1043-1447(-)